MGKLYDTSWLLRCFAVFVSSIFAAWIHRWVLLTNLCDGVLYCRSSRLSCKERCYLYVSKYSCWFLAIRCIKKSFISTELLFWLWSPKYQMKYQMISVHAILSILLIAGSYLHPIHGRLRSASKGSLVELSTPFYHQWKQTKRKSHFIMFYMIFFFCRVFWVPFFLYKTQVYMGELEITVGVGYLFCVMQFIWFYKLTQILIGYENKKEE